MPSAKMMALTYTGQILKYDYRSRRWNQVELTKTISKKLMNYHEEISSFISTRAAICILQRNDLLFHNGNSVCQISNIASPQHQKFTYCQNNQLGVHRYMISVGQTIHIISNDPDQQHKWFHLKWSVEAQNYTIIRELINSAMILDVILHHDKLWIVSTSTQNQDIKIQEYHIENNEWRDIYHYTDVYENFNKWFTSSISTVSIYNGQLILIFGDDSWSETIYIYDTQLHKLTLSPYTLPNYCMRLCISRIMDVVENHNIVKGFNRKMNNELSLNIPLHITKVLTNWFSREYIQLTCNRNDVVSWLIDVDVLLP